MDESGTENLLQVVSQGVAAPLTRSAIFLVLKINAGPENLDTVRSFCADLSAIVRAVDSVTSRTAFPA